MFKKAISLIRINGLVIPKPQFCDGSYVATGPNENESTVPPFPSIVAVMEGFQIPLQHHLKISLLLGKTFDTTATEPPVNCKSQVSRKICIFILI